MISICIPIFNQNITQLVNDLHSQAELLNIEYEILLFDDCSPNLECKIQNREITILSNVTYRELEQNIGRSAIRNLLAKEAKFQYLIFMDCDAEICSNDFLTNYIPLCRPNIVCSGGCVYSEKTPPADKYLRWYVGRKREMHSTSFRSKNASFQFTAFNVLLDKALLLACPFSERINQYGHEDTLLGIEFEKLGAEFVHINNPLVHIGIDSTDIFLKKTNLAIQNLVKIEKFESYDSFYKSVRLLRIYKRLQTFGLIKISSYILSRIEPLIIRNLKSKKPKLFLFDLYKLNQLIINKSNASLF